MSCQESQVRTDMSTSQSTSPKDEPAVVSKNHVRLIIWGKAKLIFKWALTGLPLGGIVGASFFPLQTWMQQALILLVLLWFYVFFLLDTFFLGG